MVHQSWFILFAGALLAPLAPFENACAHTVQLKPIQDPQVLTPGRSLYSLPNRVNCTSLGRIFGIRSCNYVAMPLLSQNVSELSDLFPAKRNGDPNPNGSMLCVPTSATMALSFLVDAPLRLSSSGAWVRASFAPASSPALDPNLNGRIRSFVTLMGTSVTDGTSGSGINQFAARAPEIQRAEGRSYKPTDTDRADPSLSTSLLALSVDSREVGILLVGRYKESCTLLLTGKKSCEYQRQSGHERALNGYTVSSLQALGLVSTTLRFYNPWYAAIENRSPRPYANPATRGDGRPYGAATTILVQKSGNRIEVLDRFDVIRTN